LPEAVSRWFGAERRPVWASAGTTGVRPADCFEGVKADIYLHRELSMGCFSEANQKRLTKDSPIEIYRARLPGNVRLVVSHPLHNFVVWKF